MSYPHIDLVHKALADLKAEGKVKPRTDHALVEQDKGLTTQRAAYYVYTQRDATHGVFQKSGGNVYTPPPEVSPETFSVDWILRESDGEGWDVVSDRDNGDGTGEAIVVPGGAHGPNPDNIPRWRQPTAALAQVDDTAPTPPPDGGSSTDDRLKAIEDALEAMLHLQAEQGAKIQHMMTATWAGSVALALRMNFGVTCPPMPEDHT